MDLGPDAASDEIANCAVSIVPLVTLTLLTAAPGPALTCVAPVEKLVFNAVIPMYTVSPGDPVAGFTD